MEVKNLYSLDEIAEEEINVGLMRLAKQLPESELFFQINKINDFQFSRCADLKIFGNFYDYSFTYFKGYSKKEKTCFHIFSNKSVSSLQKKEITELFSDEQNIKFLLTNYPDVDYIIKTSDANADFSVILLPENLAFQIQELQVNCDEELHEIIRYYE